jgi:hypothetical protein
MKRWLCCVLAVCGWTVSASAAREVLIVADEFPAMELLARSLKANEGLTSQIVAQTNLPPDLTPFHAVIVYIHLELFPATERALIRYTENGGRLVALHHSISSGKRKNRDWFRFLGVELPEGAVEAGGYKWIEPATLSLVQLAPAHFITTNRVTWPEQIQFGATGSEKTQALPGVTLPESEVYLNHRLTRAHQRLLGFRYTDAKGRVWMQEHAGWIAAAGKGWIVYLLPGHSARDFENSAYARLVANAVIWSPGAASHL